MYPPPRPELRDPNLARVERDPFLMAYRSNAASNFQATSSLFSNSREVAPDYYKLENKTKEQQAAEARNRHANSVYSKIPSKSASKQPKKPTEKPVGQKLMPNEDIEDLMAKYLNSDSTDDGKSREQKPNSRKRKRDPETVQTVQKKKKLPPPPVNPPKRPPKVTPTNNTLILRTKTTTKSNTQQFQINEATRAALEKYAAKK
eukprot:TRINITY_DN1385_c0_g1_i2.p1 TRINITY_DN1385_c0_g1~~TRINITY_DN1385_c0_g1_i2.p1  ORF type:complete len:203 (-),score=50.02 TRINITY_DN1385_c0_g1_i2:28-636(-)